MTFVTREYPLNKLSSSRLIHSDATSGFNSFKIVIENFMLNIPIRLPRSTSGYFGSDSSSGIEMSGPISPDFIPVGLAFVFLVFSSLFAFLSSAFFFRFSCDCVLKHFKDFANGRIKPL